MDDAKLNAELPGAPVSRPRPRRFRWAMLVAGVTLVAIANILLKYPAGSRRLCGLPAHATTTAEVCPQASALVPEKNGALWSELTALHATDAFLQRAVGRLSAAVQIPTETYDEMGPVGEDPRWITRGPFVEHLTTAFPLVHAALNLQKVNTYGLIYTWQGSDATLKPLLLMGHYDVVPVAPLSADQWTYPAYSGYFDGENIWGRGSSDDKSGVIGIMTTIEVLLEKNFAPTRTIVFSFGFDEEAGGYHGAGHLGPALLERFGPNSFAMIVDEGSGYTDQFGAIFAAPAIAEKGSVDVTIEVQTPGGHSSVPPEHTSIGILAALIVHLEANAPTPVLKLGSPPFEMAQCLAAHGPAVPHALKSAVLRAKHSKKALKKAEGMLLEDPMFRALVGTTQAVDIVSGGVKSNALPEQALAVVNHRIATQSSVNATITRDAALVKDLAARFNLSVTAYGEPLTPAAGAYGTLSLSAPRSLEPAPITPSAAPPFQLLAGTIRTVLGATYGDVQEVFVTPGMMTGNTDTRFTWALSEHIFRYGHGNMIGGLGGIHTVDEHIKVDSFIGMISFFTTLILNADEAAL
ncbi:hypothetical protein DFH07DRAFT_44200 [Mycena maculata]|uniref:Peptidase M20 dimerisation domain-containing protein n=1 Tax=Mycena maculata TaxID=230809 RepID=A0AAD7N2Y3_9AGAR|nr:hypothetical protein DFH07DRAFT_44200 [Mycena maculata]